MPTFWARVGGNLNNNFQKSQMPGGLPGGGMLKLRFDRYIMYQSNPTGTSPPPPGTFHGYKNDRRTAETPSVVEQNLYKNMAKHAHLHRSIDVKFIFDSARLALSSSANILQIADVALRVVFLLFLPCFELFFRQVLTLETSEMSAIIQVHKQNNSTSSPGLLG